MLLRERRFLPLFVTQFLGALNDNVLRNALIVLLTFQAANWTTLKPEMLANLITGVFILPLFLFSATAGEMADKFDKALLTGIFKRNEVGIVLVAGVGFGLRSLAIMIATVFLLGLNSALFGPIKYAILPQQLKANELVDGNALIEVGTFVAILLGTLLGGLLAASSNGGVITAGALGIAIAGYLASRAIRPAAPPAPNLKISINPISATWRSVNSARQNRSAFLAILGISWFWLYGAIFLAQFPAYTRNVLGGDELSVTLLLVTFTLGIGVGSLLCAQLSAGRVRLGLVYLGAIGLTLFALDLAYASPCPPVRTELRGIVALLSIPGTWRILADLALLGVSGGLFAVTLYALMQQRSDETSRARIIGANNALNAISMVIGALAAAVMLTSGVLIPALFGVAALCNAAVAVFLWWHLRLSTS